MLFAAAQLDRGTAGPCVMSGWGYTAAAAAAAACRSRLVPVGNETFSKSFAKMGSLQESYDVSRVAFWMQQKMWILKCF